MELNKARDERNEWVPSASDNSTNTSAQNEQPARLSKSVKQTQSPLREQAPRQNYIAPYTTSEYVARET